MPKGREDDPLRRRRRRAGRRSVWAVAPESVIVSPAAGATLQRGSPLEIWGWAWADRGIGRVEVSFDGGATWRGAGGAPDGACLAAVRGLLACCRAGPVVLARRHTRKMAGASLSPDAGTRSTGSRWVV